MNPLHVGFISERTRVVPPLSADPLRYRYLNLQNAEPNLGVPPSTTKTSFGDYILTSNLTGGREFKNTYIWDSTYTTFSAASGTFLTEQKADLIYFKKTGGDIIGNVFIQGNLIATGAVSALSAVYITNNVTSFSALSVFSYGYEPALAVGSQGGIFDIARFLDSDNKFVVMSIKDTYLTGRGRVGINTENPNTELTVFGSISSSDVIYFGNSNTNILLDARTNLQNNSAGWESTETTVYSLSNDWSSSNIVPLYSQFLSANPVRIFNATITNGLSVNRGLTADRIFGVFQNNAIQRFAGDGVTTDWNLDFNVSSVNDILVYVGGIYQDKGSYSIINVTGSPSKISFTEAPPSPVDYIIPLIDNKNVEVVFLFPNPLPIGFVGDGSVTENKIADRSVTSRKLASDLTLFGNLSVVGTLSASGYVLTNSYIPYQTFNVSPGQTTFSLLCAAASINDISVYVSGVYQNKNSWTLLDRNTIQLSEQPPIGNEVVEVTYMRPFPATAMYPTLNSVTSDSIINGAITSPKLDSTINIRTLTVNQLLSVAGGIVNSESLTAVNLFPINNSGDIGSSTRRWDRIFVNQIDALSSNLVIELSGFFIDGDLSINGGVSARSLSATNVNATNVNSPNLNKFIRETAFTSSLIYS